MFYRRIGYAPIDLKNLDMTFIHGVVYALCNSSLLWYGLGRPVVTPN